MKIDINKILTDPKIDSLDPVSLRWLLDVLLAVKSNSVTELIDTVLMIIDYYNEIVTCNEKTLQENVACNEKTLQENVTCNEKTLQQNVTSLQKNVTRNVTPLSGAERTRRCRERKSIKNVTPIAAENVACNENSLQKNVTQEKEKSTKKEKEFKESLLNSQQNNLIIKNFNNFNNTESEYLNQNNSENNKNNSENELKVNQNTVNLTARNEKCNEDCNENSADCNETSVTCNEKNSSRKKQKLSPDQPEYWKHAFGPNAEMAKRFSKISGVIPVGSEFGLWQKSLKDYREAGITVEQMEAAVIKYRTDMPNATIKGPNSVFSIARDLKSRKAIVVPEKTESIMDVARRLQRERDMQDKELERLP